MAVRNDRGLVLPSPVVLLSIIAVAMAAIAFFATRGGEPVERQVAITARETPASTPAVPAPAAVVPTPTKKAKPVVQRAKVYVEVYNNSSVKGLAGTVAARVGDAGWQVVGADNWYGTISATTVYFPQRLEPEAKRLALDLGIKRTAPSVDPMRQDRLTVILTGPLG
ncbi:MAG: LytR C-terminal domain-containing protein [Nocardioides sp.]|nr:LytR C-terminal domain-containing protein [Nocardioides sp.]